MSYARRRSGYPARTSYNDVWRSDDPTDPDSWEQVTASTPWAPRMWPGFCVHGDEMVLAAGYNNVTGDTNLDDTWASRDGDTWREVTGTAFSTRHFPTLFSASGRLLISNGNRNPNAPGVTLNDVLELIIPA